MPVTKECSIEGCSKRARSRGWCEMHYARWFRHGGPLNGRTFDGAPAVWLEAHKNFASAECLIWPFGSIKGHAITWKDGRNQRVCRLICEYRYGPPPTSKHETAHNCGRGHLGCVNGSHLRWATTKENAADRLIHGTSPRGERAGTAKLSEADVMAIRAVTNVSQSELGRRYGVSRSTIGLILSRRNWAWL